jgi:hypothetical protein
LFAKPGSSAACPAQRYRGLYYTKEKNRLYRAIALQN